MIRAMRGARKRTACGAARTFAAALSACVGILLVACLDATPYTMPPPANDGGANPTIDAAEDGDAATTTCRACLGAPDAPGPGCGDELAACQADPKCGAALACALADGCFDRGSLGQLVVCGLPCAKAAGIVSNDDPALTQAFDLFHCAGTTCVTPCHLASTDASLSD